VVNSNAHSPAEYLAFTAGASVVPRVP